MAEEKRRISALFIGLGSIGRRHLQNLHAVCAQNGVALSVTAVRSSKTALPPDVAKLVDKELFSYPKNERYTLGFITNPTNLHANALRQLKGQVDTFFIEKPILARPGEDTLASLGLDASQKAYVAAPMRFTALYVALKEKMRTAHPYCVRAICSSYLPTWRKGTDYRTVYSANKEMGGGVRLDLIHEWDYVTDLFGFPQKSHCLYGKYSHLEISSEDVAAYIAEYPDMLCEVHLDYFGRYYRRTLEAMCEDGSWLADFGTGVLFAPGGRSESFAEEPNHRYLREMEYFLQYALHGAKNINPPQNALRVLGLAWGDGG